MPRSIKSAILIAVMIISTGVNVYGQAPVYANEETAISLYELPPRELIDAPTAGTLPRGCFDIVMRVYANGGIIGKTSIGLSNRFMLGMSYGAEHIISDVPANENPRIEFNVKLRLINEEYFMPAVALGFNSQGNGAYLEDRERYAFKSKGFYGVISRSFYMYKWVVGGHVGINYSLENDVDDETEPTLFIGAEGRFSYDIGLALEYDIGLNDDGSDIGYAKGRGYLNAGIKWLYSENLSLEFIFKDLLQNRQEVSTIGRELRFTYIEFF